MTYLVKLIHTWFFHQLFLYIFPQWLTKPSKVIINKSQYLCRPFSQSLTSWCQFSPWEFRASCDLQAHLCLLVTGWHSKWNCHILLCLHYSQSSTPQGSSLFTPAVAWTQTCVGGHWPGPSWVLVIPPPSGAATRLCVTEPHPSTCLWLWPCVLPSSLLSGAPGSCSFTWSTPVPTVRVDFFFTD